LEEDDQDCVVVDDPSVPEALGTEVELVLLLGGSFRGDNMLLFTVPFLKFDVNAADEYCNQKNIIMAWQQYQQARAATMI
jgi:hypothetical protein